MEQRPARLAHNQEAGGSNPSPATKLCFGSSVVERRLEESRGGGSTPSRSTKPFSLIVKRGRGGCKMHNVSFMPINLEIWLKMCRWLNSEMGQDNWIRHYYGGHGNRLEFKCEEDKVKFILRWL